MVFAAAAAARGAPPPPRRTYISNDGRVVAQSERPRSFSGRRFLFLVIVGLAFWLSNPANAPVITTLEALYQDYLKSAGFPPSSSSKPGAKTTKKTPGDRRTSSSEPGAKTTKKTSGDPDAPFFAAWEALYLEYLKPLYQEFAGSPVSSSSSPPGVKTTKKKTPVDRGSQHATNFGFFSVNERATRVEIHALGNKIHCRFGDETFGEFCQALQADLCHQKPLFWDPHDRPYTTHRLFTWSLVAAGVIAYSMKDPKALLSGNVLVDSFLTIWFSSDLSSSPLLSTLGAIWQSNFFLYPVWIRLDTLVPIQHPNSWFRVVDDHDQNDLNYALSLLFLLLVAAGANAVTHMITKRFLLRGVESVVAVALGYYRGSLSNVSAATAITFPVLSSLSVNLTALHWTALLTMLMRMDFSVFSWLGANIVGAFMGEYQYQNQFTLALARQAWRSFENTLDAFFGYR
jgi:hypothetical protein